MNRYASIRGALRAAVPDRLGRPFDPKRPAVRLHEATFGAPEIWAALECLLRTEVTMGPRVRAFERRYAAKYRFGGAVLVNSGSSANLLAVSALTNPRLPGGLRPGDEVIVPALSWSTTYWPLVQRGLVPVVVDIDPATWNIDPDRAARAVGRRTRGLMLVHLYGNPCDMKAIGDLCRRRSLVLIEDCCEAMGARFGGRPVGAFGAAGTFSFYYSHHITTLEGGMCVTGDPALLELMRILRAHGWVRETADPASYGRRHPTIPLKFLFVNEGYNLRATEPQAAFGSVQLGRLDGFIRARRANAAYWRRALAEFDDVLQLQADQPGGFNSCFGFPMAVRRGAPFTAGELTAHLRAGGIETRPINVGNIVLQPAMRLWKHRSVGPHRVADDLKDRSFTFGNHQDVGPEARAYVAGRIAAFVRARRRRP
jgi:CDP-6-deoxy-D-xylo-4-hexulose-3-dehydrase